MLEEMWVANAGSNMGGKCWKKCVWQMLEEMCVANARRNVCGKCSNKCVWQIARINVCGKLLE